MSLEQEARGQEHEVRNQDPEAKSRYAKLVVVLIQEAGEQEARSHEHDAMRQEHVDW